MKPSWVFAMALGAAIGWGAYILPFDWMQKAGLAGTVIGFVVGALMIAINGLSYGFIIRALLLTGGGGFRYSGARPDSCVYRWLGAHTGVLVCCRVECVGGHARLPRHVS
ncbi:hypothetical protein QP414_10630 [Corynebacterium simulans]|uniref:hypothetical protein n=1 Tax=Corynebacterium simulans TaxID=146827 RepID=UPI002549ECF6|nr:hypothetical protein [Corynebacterium simulans]MDK7139753.1 hypothetical protein [Corynebacterium simulans]